MSIGNTMLRVTGLAVRVLVLSMLFFCLVPLARSATIYVDDDACPDNGTGTSNDPYCSIQDAIDASVSGDEVLVYPGSYAERIYMKTGVNVRKAQAAKPVIVATFKTLVKFEGVDDCALDGFILDATGVSNGSAAMIRVYDGSANITIQNCEIKGANSPGGNIAKSGIRLNGQVVANIINNTIINTLDAGITTHWIGTIVNSTVTIQGNTITGHGTAGIYFNAASGDTNRVIIGGNTLAKGNYIANNGSGSDEKGSGIRMFRISQASIENNTIVGNRRAGILLIDTSTLTPHIRTNSIHDNGESGINIGGASELTIGPGNEIYNNDVSGITFYVFENSRLNGFPESQPALITGNDIHGNAKAGIAVVDWVSGLITINGNTIHQNMGSGIAFFKNCTAVITDNDIHTHPTGAGIFTGDWSGTYPPDPDNQPSILAFDRFRGPAYLTIRRNKIHGNRSGMRLDHAAGVITNNLVYDNSRSGIRFSGDTTDPYGPFPFVTVWGITEITNNTVVDNGSHVVSTDDDRGGGIVYDDINTTVDPATGQTRNFYDPPLRDPGQMPRVIKNNITAYNKKAGIRDAVCSSQRDYNLYYGNNGTLTFVPPQISGCGFTGNPHELFADPRFIDRAAKDYRLASDSPAKNSGDDGNDLGAFGGSDPITW